MYHRGTTPKVSQEDNYETGIAVVVIVVDDVDVVIKGTHRRRPGGRAERKRKVNYSENSIFHTIKANTTHRFALRCRLDFADVIKRPTADGKNSSYNSAGYLR